MNPSRRCNVGLVELCGTVPEASQDITVLDAVRAMVEHKSGALAIMEGRTIVGVFTERDLMQRVVARGLDPGATRLGDVMTSPVVKVTNSTPVVKAAGLMRERHIRHLAIIDDDGVYKGLVPLRFLLYDMMDDLEAKVSNLYSFVMADGPGGD